MKRLECVNCGQPEMVEPSVIRLWCKPCSDKIDEESRRLRSLRLRRGERHQKRLV